MGELLIGPEKARPFNGGSVLVQEVLGERDALFRQYVGAIASSVVAGHEIKVSHDQPYSSLLEGIRYAKEGEPAAIKMVMANAKTDMIERTIKAGYISDSVKMEIGPDGFLSQYGQSYLSVQANSLRSTHGHDLMFDRTKAEARNAYRLQELIATGELKDYAFVVFSKAENLPDKGFYTDTMSCAIQVSTLSDDGKFLETETAFVAGKNSKESKVDDKAIARIYKSWANQDVSGKRPSEIIDMPILVPKSLIPNGGIDVVRAYDEAAGGTFFGQNVPPADYFKFKELCRVRDQRYDDGTKQITAELINAADRLTSPAAAAALLTKLSKEYSVKMAVRDKSIDLRVFGDKSARHIIWARRYDDIGLAKKANEHLAIAQRNDVSVACAVPVGVAEAGNEESDSMGSLSFMCRKGHLNRRERNKLLETCQVCGESVRC